MISQMTVFQNTRKQSLFVVALLAATATMILIPTSEVQAQSADNGTWEVPRTSDGHPDLQGNWTNSTLTPFERPEGREPVFTWEEVEQRERGIDGCPPNPGTVECGRQQRQGSSNEARLSGNEYNEVYWERGTTIAIGWP